MEYQAIRPDILTYLLYHEEKPQFNIQANDFLMEYQAIRPDILTYSQYHGEKSEPIKLACFFMI